MDIHESEVIKFKNIIRLTLRDAKTGEIVKQVEQENLVVTVGKQLVLDRLGGLVGTIYGAITYGAVGTGTNAAAAGDTTLQTESARNAATYSRSGSTGTFSVFFNTSEANATIWEVGFFGGAATSTANSGTLYDRIKLAASIAKTSSYTLTVEVDVTIT